jgi:hydroxymethylbilane synthase
MALAQTERVKAELERSHPKLREPGAIEIVPILTTADRIQDRLLADIGGKALFTKEIEEALLSHKIDLAVHSMKDVPTWLPPGLEIACILERDDPRDALISTGGLSLKQLPADHRIGTSSLRRKAQILHHRPDLKVVPLRGNANTRLRKLGEGIIDATLLAYSGLVRISRTDAISEILPIDVILPAVGQGALGVEIRSEDDLARLMLQPLRHQESELCLLAERSFLAELDGSCHTPIAGLAVVTPNGNLSLRGVLATPEGEQLHEDTISGHRSDASKIGIELAKLLRKAEGTR